MRKTTGTPPHAPRVQLIHWNQAEAGEKIALLRRAGYEVAFEPLAQGALRELKTNPPSAVVIDLSRRPVQGRDIAVAIRHRKTTQAASIVFVGGDPEKVKRIRELLRDAVYTDWKNIRASLRRAISNPPVVTVVPRSVLAGYSGTPLPKKLGIKANSIVLLINPPLGFEETLGDLPEGVKLITRTSVDNDLIIWFVRSLRTLELELARFVPLIGKGGIWIAWPKKTSRLATDLTQTEVRAIALASGLVDYKVCAIDSTWSGLRFAVRGRKR